MKTAKNSIIRLYQYREALVRFKTLGYQKIFSSDLADAVSASAVQIRKDFSLFGISGNKRGGYVIAELIHDLDVLLRKDQVRRVIIVGVGNIGRALMNYEGFTKEGIHIEAAFDIDPMKHDRNAQIPILPVEDLHGFIVNQEIKIAIIAVPFFAAQQVLDILLAAGIQGVVNFSPGNLKTPDDIFINNINVQLEIDIVDYFVNAMQGKD